MNTQQLADNFLHALQVAVEERGISYEEIKANSLFKSGVDAVINKQIDIDQFLKLCDNILLANPHFAK